MTVKVHLRALTPGELSTESVTIVNATSWEAGPSGVLDLRNGDDALVTTFAAGSWLYAEVAS
jgi:hypothetical protein